MPAMEMTLRIEIFAHDVDKVGRFYRDVLGFDELSRLRDFRLFDADGYYLRVTSRPVRQTA
jgi:catechol 2,3-dioxygenase-like lactoylglutathione lyase family enzyme